MSRHRNIRKMNYDEECDIDEVYGRSVEDDYCISPNTAAEFMYDRTAQNFSFSHYLTGDNDDIPEEEAEAQKPEDGSQKPLLSRQLNELDQARLQSCLDEICNVVGDSIPTNIIKEAIITNNFDVEKSLDKVLSDNNEVGATPQRVRRDRNKKDDDNFQNMFSTQTRNLKLNLSSLIKQHKQPSFESPVEKADNLTQRVSCSPTLLDLAKQNQLSTRPTLSLSNLLTNLEPIVSNDSINSSDSSQSNNTSLMDLARLNFTSSNSLTSILLKHKQSNENSIPSISIIPSTLQRPSLADLANKQNIDDEKSLDLSHALKVHRLSEGEDSGIGSKDTPISLDSSPGYSSEESYPKPFYFPSNPALKAFPSLFAKIACLRLRNCLTPPTPSSSLLTTPKLDSVIFPFDFSDPSPDDVVKNIREKK